MKHYNILIFIILWFNGLFLHKIESCTMICAGKKATKDGSVLIAHTDDAGDGTSDLRLIKVPSADHLPNSLRPVYNFENGYPRLLTNERGPHYHPNAYIKSIEKDDIYDNEYIYNQENDFINSNTSLDNKNQTNTNENEPILSIPMGYIPQIKHTYAYFDQDYGMMNEVQLSIGESTCGAKTVGWPKSFSYGYNLFGIAELTKIALERCDSARCAIQTMGDLAVQYGFFSEDSGDPNNPDYGDSAEALGIADKYGEVWLFHILTGAKNTSAVWVAQRVPDTDISVIANGFVIREIDLKDTNNYLASNNIYSVAEELGFWNKNEIFDFTAVYGFDNDYPISALYVGRRMWRVFDLVTPSLKLNSTLGYSCIDKTYPISVTPDTLIDVKTFQRILRDYYKDTPYDMSQSIAAGPYNMPIRYDGSNLGVQGGWERPISMFRTMFSFILVAKSSKNKVEDGIHGVIWYGQASPHGTVYIPFSCQQDSVPQSYLIGKQSEFNMKSSWWAFSFVNNWSYLRYNVISQDILLYQKTLQEKAFQFHEHTIKKSKKILLLSTNLKIKQNKTLNDDVIYFLEKENNNFANYVVNKWWNLALKLIGKYSDGYVITGEKSKEMKCSGYPKWFLLETNFNKWPGNTIISPNELRNNKIKKNNSNKIIQMKSIGPNKISLKRKENNNEKEKKNEKVNEKNHLINSNFSNIMIKITGCTVFVICGLYLILRNKKRNGYNSI